MHPDLKYVMELQQVDLRLERLAQELEAFPERQRSVEARIQQLRQAGEQRKTRLADNIKERKKCELEIQSLQQKISKLKDQQFEVKSNEAYRALTHEIEAAEKSVAQWEDRLLEKMIEAETLEKEIKAGEGEDKQTIAELEREKQTLEAGREARSQELASLKAHQGELRVQVTGDVLQLYDHLAKLRKGVALAEAREGICQECRVRILPQVYNAARANAQIIQCDSCDRILYYVEAALEAQAEKLEA